MKKTLLFLIILVCIIAFINHNASTELKQNFKSWVSSTFSKKPTRKIILPEVSDTDEDTEEQKTIELVYPVFDYTDEQIQKRVIECTTRYNIPLNLFSAVSSIESSNDPYATNREKNVVKSIRAKGGYYKDVPDEWKRYTKNGAEHYLSMSCGLVQVQAIYGKRASMDMPDMDIKHPAQMADPMINICVGAKMIRDCIDRYGLKAFREGKRLTVAFAKCHNGKETKSRNPKWIPDLEAALAEGVFLEALRSSLRDVAVQRSSD